AGASSTPTTRSAAASKRGSTTPRSRSAARASPSARASCGTATPSRTQSGRAPRPTAIPSSRNAPSASRTAASSPGPSATTCPTASAAGIGTPDELVGAAGAVLAELDRRAWGRTEPLDGARASTPLRFQGQYEDAETGLFYNRFRYYDPAAGLYLSPDPLGLDGGLRAYGYGDNPTGWIDPLGLMNGRPPHYATVTVSRGGQVILQKELNSKNMTPEEKALGWPNSMFAAHTEARACRQIPLQPGDTMHIAGQLEACDRCKGAMNAKHAQTGANITYDYPGGETWTAGKKKRRG
ncbi:MAG: hypothetical protein KC492_28245, partial [Myxococcales bacterium]|nr:hypothetical protein [Myxococcales bacterium]